MVPILSLYVSVSISPVPEHSLNTAGIIGTHGNAMGNWWDFFKPDLASEYPSVDGPLTLHSYIGGLEQSYENYIAKESKKAAAKSSKKEVNGHAANGTNGHSETPEFAQGVKDFDYICFHGPYGKLVQKGTARLVSLLILFVSPFDFWHRYRRVEEMEQRRKANAINILTCSLDLFLVEIDRCTSTTSRTPNHPNSQMSIPSSRLWRAPSRS